MRISVGLDHGDAAGLELGGQRLEVAEEQSDLLNGPTLRATAEQHHRRRRGAPAGEKRPEVGIG
jgi:hypothetical protein